MRNVYHAKGSEEHLHPETMSLVMDKSKSKKKASVSDEFASFTEVQLDISDLPLVQNKDYQYSVSHLDILK